MKVPLLIFMAGLERGGCEEYGLAVAQEANRRRYATHVCFPHLEQTRMLLAEFRRTGTIVHNWSVARNDPRWPWGTFDNQKQQATELLGKVQPSYVWLALPWVDAGLGFMAGCAEMSIGGLCVWQLATEVVSIPEAEAMWARKSLTSGLNWVAVSEESRAFIADSFRVNKSRIGVVYNGLLSSEKVQPASSEMRKRRRHDVRRELGLARDARLVITVARLCREQKGHEFLLEAISKLTHLENTYFIWVGDGLDAQWLKQQVAQSGAAKNIRMLGYRSDIARLLTASDLFVLPSNLEGMPFTIFEAMASGCPVIATKTGGIAEVLTHDKDSILVPVRNPDALRIAIEEALESPALPQRLSQQAYRTVARHTAERMLSQSFSLLENGSAYKTTHLSNFEVALQH